MVPANCVHNATQLKLSRLAAEIVSAGHEADKLLPQFINLRGPMPAQARATEARAAALWGAQQTAAMALQSLSARTPEALAEKAAALAALIPRDTAGKPRGCPFVQLAASLARDLMA